MEMNDKNDQVNDDSNEPDFKDLISQAINNFVELPDVSSQLEDSRTKLIDSFEEYFKDTGISESLSELSNQALNLVVSAQPHVYEALRESVSQFFSSIDISSIIAPLESTIKTITSKRFIDIQNRTQWPLFFIDSQAVIDEIARLDDEVDDDTLTLNVYSIAQNYLNQQWVLDIQKRWANLNIVDDDKKHLLSEALQRHIDGDYYASVLLLITLFSGFIENYGEDSIDIAIEQQKTFEQRLSEYGLKKKNIERPNSLKTKDYLILCSLFVDYNDSIWKSIFDYFFYTILYSDTDYESLAEHNPLRNKICHGEQTNYGTWEHSIKLILSIDLLFKIGDAIYMALNLKAI